MRALLEPELLLKTIPETHSLVDRVTGGAYTLLDERTPLLRFRGTLQEPGTGGRVILTGFQRNILKIRKSGSSLPTIISIVLDGGGAIEKIELDGSFKGSKGLLCSRDYLQANLSTLAGVRLDKKFLHRVKESNMHCFHVTEVLRGMYSFYHTHGGGKGGAGVCFEEEAVNAYVDGDDLILTGLQEFQTRARFVYAFVFRDVFKKITYSKSIRLQVLNGMRVEFFIGSRLALVEDVNVNDAHSRLPNLVRFVTTCVEAAKSHLHIPDEIKYFNTNIYPVGLYGLFNQAVGIRFFYNNYAHMLRVFDSIQRNVFTPLCIGALHDQAEADRYFPLYRFSEIFGRPEQHHTAVRKSK